ncbi:hypothetical protein JOC85_002951 [Bacillus mesophilus]|uniref:M28 family peptidase n=1 Tax=Bacillus mesophilus TaxID=1808955 RepID=A0A6M0Q8A1_9BACI|nr:M28 family metallopeptidase [Bacillus mesophilus]MBM7662144.1 hypothetical protein [Bacillus mesophilus]NEY72503.1 M28 family peptidase [Bacillus mesophilus]
MVKVNGIAESLQKIVEMVSKENLMEYTSKVSSEVRLSGTSEELRAFRYVKETLESFGVSTNLQHNDAYISLPISASLKVNSQPVSCITHSMAASTPKDGLQGEIMYVGKGTDEDYENLHIDNKVVILDGLAVPGAVKKAQDFGAIAAIFINAEYTHEMIVSPVWGNPTPETISLLPNIPVVSVNYHDGLMIKKNLQKGSSSNLHAWIKTEVDTGWRKIPTLTAEIKGSTDSEHYVLFSGHIDSWHYGAMDNGSANATMIEIARILSHYKTDLRRSLRFAFWSGHSHGRYAGSTLYCDANWEDLHDHCVLHINVDSVGAKDAVVLSEANCMAETKELGGRIVEEFTGQTFYGTRFGRAGDQSFLGAGIPSLFMGLSEQELTNTPATEAFAQLFGGGRAGGFGWWWHTTEDTIDKIDPDNLERDCKIYAAVVAKACTDDVIPINQLAAVDELREALLNYQKISINKLDLSVSVKRIEELKNLTSKLQDATVMSLSDECITLVNLGLLKLSRILVPLNYVQGDLFHHDPAMKQFIIPALADIEKLASCQEGDEEYYMLKTKLFRQTNKVNYMLKQAILTVEDVLDKLSS